MQIIFFFHFLLHQKTNHPKLKLENIRYRYIVTVTEIVFRRISISIGSVRGLFVTTLNLRLWDEGSFMHCYVSLSKLIQVSFCDCLKREKQKNKIVFFKLETKQTPLSFQEKIVLRKKETITYFSFQNWSKNISHVKAIRTPVFTTIFKKKARTNKQVK
jgi:hypothetical protein